MHGGAMAGRSCLGPTAFICYHVSSSLSPTSSQAQLPIQPPLHEGPTLDTGPLKTNLQGSMPCALTPHGHTRVQLTALQAHTLRNLEEIQMVPGKTDSEKVYEPK